MKIPIITPALEWVGNLPWYVKIFAFIALLLLIIFMVVLVFIIASAIVGAIAVALVALLTMGASSR